MLTRGLGLNCFSVLFFIQRKNAQDVFKQWQLSNGRNLFFYEEWQKPKKMTQKQDNDQSMDDFHLMRKAISSIFAAPGKNDKQQEQQQRQKHINS